MRTTINEPTASARGSTAYYHNMVELTYFVLWHRGCWTLETLKIPYHKDLQLLTRLGQTMLGLLHEETPDFFRVGPLHKCTLPSSGSAPLATSS